MQDEEERAEIASIKFEWYPPKAASNLQRHKVSFEEAKTVFGDKKHVVVPDQEHSFDERRYLAIGRSESGRILTMCFAERGERIRIISARLAEPWERREYEISND